MVLRLATLLRPSQWQDTKNNSRIDGPTTDWATVSSDADICNTVFIKCVITENSKVNNKRSEM